MKFLNTVFLFSLIIIAQTISANESTSYQERFNGTYQRVNIDGVYFAHIDHIPRNLENYCPEKIQIINNINPEDQNEIYIYGYNYYYNKHLRSNLEPELPIKKSQSLFFFFRNNTLYENGKKPMDLDQISGFYDVNNSEGTCKDEKSLAVCLITGTTGFAHYKIKRKSTPKSLSYKFSTRESGAYQYARIKKRNNAISLKRKGLTRSSGSKFRNRKSSEWDFTCNYVPVNLFL